LVELYRAFLSEHLPRDVVENVRLSTFWAAQANTIPTAFWTLYFLLLYPQAYREIEQEIKEQLTTGEKKEDFLVPLLSRDLLSKLPKTESAIYEAMRMITSVMLCREATETLDFNYQVPNPKGGTTEEVYTIRKGDRVVSCAEFTHTDEQIYENPSEYKFDRFTQKDSAMFCRDGKPVSASIMSFGYGSTMCPGRFLAIQSIKQLLVYIVLLIDLKVPSHNRVKPSSIRFGLGVPRPLGDVPITWRRKTNTK